MTNISSGTRFFDGYYATPYRTSRTGDPAYNVYSRNGSLVGSSASDSLDSYINFLSRNASNGANSSSTNSSRTNPSNYFQSDEFKAFKNLSLELAQKAEDRDLRLMNEARNKRNQEYQRNYNEASSLYNAGQSYGYGSGSMGSRRYDGMG